MDQIQIKSSTFWLLLTVTTFGCAALGMSKLLWSLIETDGIYSLTIIFPLLILSCLAIFILINRNFKLNYKIGIFISGGITITAAITNIIITGKLTGALPYLLLGTLSTFITPLFFKKHFTK